jgi:hypothetical protein
MKKKTEKVHKKNLPGSTIAVLLPRKKGGPIKVDSNLEFLKHADTQEADDQGFLERVPIHLTINATPDDWQKLDAAITDDRETVIDNLRLITEAAIEKIREYGRPKGRPFAETKLIDQIKRAAPILYAYLQCYKDEREKPEPIQRLLSLLASKGHIVEGYKVRAITLATMKILYEKKAKDELLKPFKNPDNFYKTYVLPQLNPYIKEDLKNRPNKIPSLDDVFKVLKIPLKGTAKPQ